MHINSLYADSGFNGTKLRSGALCDPEVAAPMCTDLARACGLDGTTGFHGPYEDNLVQSYWK